MKSITKRLCLSMVILLCVQPADLLRRYDVNGDGSVTVADRDSLIGILIRE